MPPFRRRAFLSARSCSRRAYVQERADVHGSRLTGISTDVTDEALSEVQRALEHLDSAGIARIRSELGNPLSPRPKPGFRERVREMGLGWIALFALFRAFDAILRVGRRRVPPNAWDLGAAVGVVDIRRHRACLDYGGYAVLEKEDQEWSGGSGLPLSAVGNKPRPGPLRPLWLIDLLRGAQSAELQGEPTVGATRFHVTADLAAAVEASGYDLALPGSGTYRSLAELPLVVETRDGRLASIRFASDWADFGIQFVDFGRPLSVDWERLPHFRDTREGVNPGFGLADDDVL